MTITFPMDVLRNANPCRMKKDAPMYFRISKLLEHDTGHSDDIIRNVIFPKIQWHYESAHALDAFWSRIEISPTNECYTTLMSYELLFHSILKRYVNKHVKSSEAMKSTETNVDSVWDFGTSPSRLNQELSMKVPFSWKQARRRAWLHYWIISCDIPIRIDPETGYLHFVDLASFVSNRKVFSYIPYINRTINNPAVIFQHHDLYIRLDYFLCHILPRPDFPCETKARWKEEEATAGQVPVIKLPISPLLNFQMISNSPNDENRSKAQNVSDKQKSAIEIGTEQEIQQLRLEIKQLKDENNTLHQKMKKSIWTVDLDTIMGEQNYQQLLHWRAQFNTTCNSLPGGKARPLNLAVKRKERLQIQLCRALERCTI